MADDQLQEKSAEDSWKRLRGLLKEIFSEPGGGEAYLRAERSHIYERWDEDDRQSK